MSLNTKSELNMSTGTLTVFLTFSSESENESTLDSSTFDFDFLLTSVYNFLDYAFFANFFLLG